MVTMKKSGVCITLSLILVDHVICVRALIGGLSLDWPTT